LPPGFPTHAIPRGIDRGAVFFDGSDLRFVLNCLGASAAENGVAVHAWVLMNNPLRLLLTSLHDAAFPWS
jgi:putative transposase